VAAYLRQLQTSPLLAPERTSRHRVVLGQEPNGTSVVLTTGARNVLIAGDPRSGKSWVAGLLCEQLVLQRYCVCVIDPEGDYRPLQSLPGMAVLGGDDPPPSPHQVARALRHPDASVVIDLSRMPHPGKRDYVAALLMTLAELRRQTGLPHRIVIDEAHYFLQEPSGRTLLEVDLAGYAMVSYRLSEVPSDVLAACGTVLATRVTDPREVQALLALYEEPAAHREWAETLADISLGEAVLLPTPNDPTSLLRRFRLAPRLLPHVRHRQKYLDVPIAEHQAFVFTCGEAAPERRARTLQEFCAMLGECPPEALDGHLRRGDVSRWLAGVFGDHPLAARLREVEEQHCLGRLLDARDRVIALIEDRYLLATDPAESSE
jgi:hypothetical protein